VYITLTTASSTVKLIISQVGLCIEYVIPSYTVLILLIIHLNTMKAKYGIDDGFQNDFIQKMLVACFLDHSVLSRVVTYIRLTSHTAELNFCRYCDRSLCE